MKNIAIIFGGVSCEHDISVITAIQTINALDKSKYNALPVYISKSGKWFYSKKFTSTQMFVDFDEKKYPQAYVLPQSDKLYVDKKGINSLVAAATHKIDCAIICCHGLNGEDGSVQGLLQLSRIPYTSSSVISSAVCMDKVIMKQLFQIANLPVTPYTYFTKCEFESAPNKCKKNVRRVKYPVIVKPANLGSSIGITVCKTEAQLDNALKIAFEFDNKVIVEHVVSNLVEVNCAVIGNAQKMELSRLVVPQNWQEFLSFDDKYLLNNKHGPAKKVKLDSQVKRAVKKISKVAFKNLDCSGVVRIDFLVNAQTDEVFINEINTIPGSLACFMFKQYSPAQLLDKLIELALLKFDDWNAHNFSYSSPVLTASNNNNAQHKCKGV